MFRLKSKEKSSKEIQNFLRKSSTKKPLKLSQEKTKNGELGIIKRDTTTRKTIVKNFIYN